LHFGNGLLGNLLNASAGCADYGIEEISLGGESAVERANAYVGPVGYRFHGGLEPVLGKDVTRSF
jgi:hypothetical protein